MKLFVCLVIYTASSLEIVEKHVKAHREYLQNGYDEGFLLASGPREPRVGGIVIGRFDNIKSAMEFAKNDPYCINNVARYEIIEFDAVMHNDVLNGFLGEDLEGF